MNDGGDARRRREGPSTSLLETLQVLRRRWFILAATCAVTTAVVFGLGLRRAPGYHSEATIEVAPDAPLTGHEPIADASARSTLLWENHFRTQESLLRRPGLLAGVLESLTPDKVSKYLASAEPAQALSEDLEIAAEASTFLIRIRLDHDRADAGPAIVNRLVALFLEDSNRRLRELKAGASLALNTESLPVIRQKLAEAEAALRDFDEEKGFGVTKERYQALLESSRKIAERRLDVRMRAIGIRSRPDPRTGDAADAKAPEEGASTSALEAQRTALELELARQKVLLKDKHPTILALQGQIAATEALIRDAAKAAAGKRERELTSADVEERALDEEEARLNARLSKDHELVGRRQTLEAEVAAARDLLNSYVKRQGELEAMSGAGLPSVRVVDLARDPQPLKPKHGLALMLGLVAGLTLGVIAVFVADQLDDRLMNPLQAESALGLDALGAIPRLPPAPGGRNLPRAPVDGEDSETLEPFRRLRSEIAARLGDDSEGAILAVLSSNYGEGKSTVAINLARALALEGRRVLLVDTDLRRPGLKAFMANRNAPGLEEHLGNGLALSRCVQPSRIPGVRLLAPSGPIPGPAEAASSPRFRAMWRTLKASFDFVVVDTSPIEAASEAAVIAAGADASLLVVEERRTRVGEAVRARRRLDTHCARLLGVVVNRSNHGLPPEFESTRAFLSIDRISEDQNAFLEVG